VALAQLPHLFCAQQRRAGGARACLYVTFSSVHLCVVQANLKTIFEGLHASYAAIDGRITANLMKDKVQTVLRVWQVPHFPRNSLFLLSSCYDYYDFILRVTCKILYTQAWSLFPEPFLSSLETIFLGAEAKAAGDKNPGPEVSAALPAAGPALLSHGYGSDEDDIDGVPLDATTPGSHATLQPRSMSLVNHTGGDSDDDDVDGVPLDVVTLTKPHEVAVTPTTEAAVMGIPLPLVEVVIGEVTDESQRNEKVSMFCAEC
jgi:hypothetical protein